MEAQVMAALAMIFGIGSGAAALVFPAVTIARGMLGEHKRRRVILPTVGILVGWIMMTLVLTIMESEPSARHAAIVALGGFWAYVVAANLHAHGKDARSK